MLQPPAPAPALTVTGFRATELEQKTMSDTTRYAIRNMKCGGCVSAATEAVQQLDGVESVDIDLDSASGTVTGSVAPQQVIDALTAAGYPAELAGG